MHAHSRLSRSARQARAALILAALCLFVVVAGRVRASASADAVRAPVVEPARRALTSDTVLHEIKLIRARAEVVERRENQRRWLHTVASMHAVERARYEQQRLEMWETLARCENAGDWTVVDRFGGGLGIYIGTWLMFGGEEFASNPGYATKEQQIIVAERIYARYGLDGWGCARTLGWLD